MLKNYNPNGARLRVFRADQPNDQTPIAMSGTLAGNGDGGLGSNSETSIETVLPAGTPSDKLVVEVEMPVAGGHVVIYRGTITDDGSNYFCIEASGTAYIPSGKPCENTQAVEAKKSHLRTNQASW